EDEPRRLRRHHPVARTELRAAAPGGRREVPDAGFAAAPAARAAKAPRRAPAGDADRPEAGVPGDLGGTDGRRAPGAHRETDRRLQDSPGDRAPATRGAAARGDHLTDEDRVRRAADRR